MLWQIVGLSMQIHGKFPSRYIKHLYLSISIKCHGICEILTFAILDCRTYMRLWTISLELSILQNYCAKYSLCTVFPHVTITERAHDDDLLWLNSFDF